MMRTLYSGVSGLQVHQTKMDVIANNISNVNTVGYKKAVTTFSDSLAQSISSASGANAATGRGGINGAQVGLGVGLSSVSNVMTTGYSQRTNNSNDIMINGSGFFIVGDAQNSYFTRAGAFSVDESGNLVDVNGYILKGWEAVDDPDNPGSQKIVSDKVKDINIYSGDKSYSPPQVTSNVSFSGNINPKLNSTQSNTMSFYDSVGNRYTVDITSKYDETTGEWTSKIGNLATVNGDSKNKVVLQFSVQGTDAAGAGAGITTTSPTAGATGNVPAGGADFNFGFTTSGTVKEGTSTTAAKGDGNKFNISGITILGKYEGEETPAGGTLEYKVSTIASTSTFGTPIKLDIGGLTQFNTAADATVSTKDGYTAGSMTGYSIGADGVIVGNYSNGVTKKLFQVALANFSNPSGLEKVGNNLYKATLNSGEFDGIGVDASALGTSFIGGAVEMSNVDLSSEFTDMITTQRGYQANSRSITTADEMIQELLNLKR